VDLGGACWTKRFRAWMATAWKRARGRSTWRWSACCWMPAPAPVGITGSGQWPAPERARKASAWPAGTRSPVALVLQRPTGPAAAMPAPCSALRRRPWPRPSRSTPCQPAGRAGRAPGPAAAPRRGPDGGHAGGVRRAGPPRRLVDYLHAHARGGRWRPTFILKPCCDTLSGPMWPSAIRTWGVSLGDCWGHPAVPGRGWPGCPSTS
jgi:hypothetical protein